MGDTKSQDKHRLGFLSAIEIAELGYVGGLLVTNHLGRPLEFQCTSPVKPNQTQQILYGPTLVPYVLSELIGSTLLEKVAVKPHLVLVDDLQILETRNHSTVPVAYLGDKSNDGDTATATETGETVSMGKQLLRFHVDYAKDRSQVEHISKAVPRDADLREPFERVQEALKETMVAGMQR